MFLPRIFSLLAILAVLTTACRRPQQAAIEPHELVQVVAGTGNVEPDLVDRVHRTVLAELPSLLELFENRPTHRFFVHVHESRDSMPEALLAGLHEDTVGFAMLGHHQVHLVWSELVRTGSSLAGVVRHELVHELLDQYAEPNGRHLPRWFHEGLAQVVAGDTYLGAREEDLVWRVAGSSLPSFGSLDERFPSTTTQLRTAYAQSYSYVAWLSRRYGMPLLLHTVRNTDQRTSFARSLVARTNRTTLQLEDAWRYYVLHGSGAGWRVLFENWFALMCIAVLPVLVLAMIRRLRKEERASQHLRQRARLDAEAAAAARREREQAQWIQGPPLPPWLRHEGDDADGLARDGEHRSG